MGDLQTLSQVLQLFADPTRLRLLAILQARELSVAELTAITGLGQSRVSTHLGRLREAGLVADRPAGAANYYSCREPMPAVAQSVWRDLREELHDAVVADDLQRSIEVVAARNTGGWPDAVAGEMERHYSPGRTWEALARSFLGLLRLGRVLDIGSGDGAVASMIAPRATRFVGIDRSPSLVAAARHRLRDQPSARFCIADLHALPFTGGHFDHALLLHVLECATEPQVALREAGRVLAADGSLTVATLAKHDKLEISASYGHLRAGYEPSELTSWLVDAGFAVDHCAITSRERRHGRFAVITAFARKLPPHP